MTTCTQFARTHVLPPSFWHKAKLKHTFSNIKILIIYYESGP